jgi:KaiC/GvpD/RAD55 family RecA-like ATPase
MAQLIRFGIPSLDRLLGQRADLPQDSNLQADLSRDSIPDLDDFGVGVLADKADKGDTTATTSFCLIGRDGSGKSVLALHLASRYLADCHPNDDPCATKVLYISTDLTFSKAEQIWENFDLGNPKGRKNPFEKPYQTSVPSKIVLEPMKVNNAQALADHLYSPLAPTVAFVDLAELSAGDDWAFMNRILAGLDDKPGPRHLLVIDAIEGFETLIGERDAYGEKLSRRSRIAQVMRLAAGRCHIVFVVEESETGIRQPEEFVTDVVIRLHSVEVNRYSRRTVEVEKVRGQSHARGQHSFTIRKGKGSTTGRGDSPYQKYFINPDDPKVPHQSIVDKYQSYVVVFPSLHFQSREIMELPNAGAHEADSKCAGFGIRYLDEMLVEGTDSNGLPIRGLPVGKVTALIGDLGTQRTGLGHSLLAECFAGLGKKLNQILKKLPVVLPTPSQSNLIDKDLASCIEHTAKKYKMESEILNKTDWLASELAVVLKDVGVAVLLTTTQDIDALTLAGEFAGWLCDEVSKAEGVNKDMLKCLLSAGLVTRIVCRRLEVHDLSSAVLMHIVQQAVSDARKRNGESDDRQIRVVIDDFSTWKEIYPDIRNEPLFLPSLLFYLRREGVVTLIIDSHPGRPDISVTDPFDSELRALVDHALYTWRVPFYGESRIAIAPIPPLSNGITTRIPGSAPRTVVRELKWSPPESQRKRPEVDPHFELYTGLEEGRPQPVGLEIRLYAETSEFHRYIEEQNDLLRELFTPTSGADKIIRPIPPESYDTLRDLCTIQRGTRLDHTLILQVDEFWSLRRHEGFRLQKPYLAAVTWKNKVADQTEDAIGLFRPGLNSKWKSEKGLWCRANFFVENGYKLFRRDKDQPQDKPKEVLEETVASTDGGIATPRGKPKQVLEKPEKVLEEIDRIPFSWDFGFLLCNLQAWMACQDREVPFWHHESVPPRSPLPIKKVWNDLPRAWGRGDDLTGFSRKEPPSSANKTRPTWREFLGACKVVAHAHSAGGSSPILPFDASLTSAESFSSLIIEVWASEAYRWLRKEEKERLIRRQWVPPEWAEQKGKEFFSLRRYTIELYLTWLLLVDVVDLSRFAQARKPFDPVLRGADSKAVAVRHWYKSACAAQEAASSEVTVPVGLPGHFSVRGDWFLAVASASRSSRLADRALDLLNSRRGQFVRMQLGLGLPTRNIAVDRGDRLRTQLISPCLTKKGKLDPGRTAHVVYDDLRKIGEQDNDEHVNEFYWLWRSAFRDYDLLSRIWQKSLVRMAVAWNDFRHEKGDSWVNGFEMYDRLCYYMKKMGKEPLSNADKKIDTRKLQGLMEESDWQEDDPNSFVQFSESWNEFRELCELTVRLFQMTVSDDYRPGTG